MKATHIDNNCKRSEMRISVGDKKPTATVTATVISIASHVLLKEKG